MHPLVSGMSLQYRRIQQLVGRGRKKSGLRKPIKRGLTLQYNLACYTCLLGNVEEARKLIEEAIELGGDVVRLRALDDEHLIRVWAGP